MLRNILIVCVILCGLALISTIALAGDPTAVSTAVGAVVVDNPAYQSWAEFQPGSSATYTCTTKTGETTTETTVTYTLKEVTEEKVVLALDTVTVSDEGEAVKAETIECPAKIEKTETPKPTEEGKETIKVGDEEIATTWTKTATDAGTTTVWTSETVPGGTVKSVAETTVEEVTTTVTMVLTGYNAATPEEEPEPPMKGE